MSGPSAKIIADSVSPEGVRLVTFQVTFHRFVLAEFNTHRVLSRNSASSRAIPLRKQIERLRGDAAWPISWPTEQKGMQGGEELDDIEPVLAFWNDATKDAIEAAEACGEYGLHKSVANRLLEPFMWHTAVVSGTAFQNFFDQRCSPLAQPEIKAVADLMHEAYVESDPRKLREGEWHLPYIEEEDWDAARQRVDLGLSIYPLLTEISAARCARVSYLTQEGKRDIEEDLRLYDRLTTAKPAHWSPLEHVATPWPENRQDDCPAIWIPVGNGRMQRVKTDHLPRVGNLLGWRSLRTEVEAMQGKVTFR